MIRIIFSFILISLISCNKTYDSKDCIFCTKRVNVKRRVNKCELCCAYCISWTMKCLKDKCSNYFSYQTELEYTSSGILPSGGDSIDIQVIDDESRDGKVGESIELKGPKSLVE